MTTPMIALITILLSTSAFAQQGQTSPTTSPTPNAIGKEFLCYQDFFAETGDPNWDIALLFLRIKKANRTDGSFDCTLGHTAGGFGAPSIAEIVPCMSGVDGNQRLVYEAEELELDMHIDVSTLIVVPPTEDGDEDAKGPTEYYASAGSIKMNDIKKRYYELVRHKFRCVEAKGSILNDRLWKL